MTFASLKCLLNPSQLVSARRFFISALLEGLEVVWQVQTTRASILLVVKYTWNKGTILILESVDLIWMHHAHTFGSEGQGPLHLHEPRAGQLLTACTAAALYPSA